MPAFFDIAMAKQAGNHQPEGPDACWQNKKRPYRGDHDDRGLAKAEERHELNEERRRFKEYNLDLQIPKTTTSEITIVNTRTTAIKATRIRNATIAVLMSNQPNPPGRCW